MTRSGSSWKVWSEQYCKNKMNESLVHVVWVLLKDCCVSTKIRLTVKWLFLSVWDERFSFYLTWMRQVNHWQRYSDVMEVKAATAAWGSCQSVHAHTHTHSPGLHHSVSVKPRGADRAAHKRPRCQRWLGCHDGSLQQHNVPTPESMLSTNT